MSDIDSDDEKSIISNTGRDISDDDDNDDDDNDSEIDLKPSSKNVSKYPINKFSVRDFDDDDYDDYDDESDNDIEPEPEPNGDVNDETKNIYSGTIDLNMDEDGYNDDDDDEDDDDDDDLYLQKFNSEINKNYILDYHPECIMQNNDEINTLSKIVRDSNNNIIDDLHKTLPYLTKYEKTRVLGQRAMQINTPNAKVYVKVPDGVIDGYVIAKMELEQKKIPFIICRPLPSGGSEYWKLQDLEIINF